MARRSRRSQKRTSVKKQRPGKREFQYARPSLFTSYKNYHVASYVKSEVQDDFNRPKVSKELRRVAPSIRNLKKSSPAVNRKFETALASPFRKDSEKFEQFKREVCRSRRSRREVLFAKRKTGTGGSKNARWSAKSFIKC